MYENQLYLNDLFDLLATPYGIEAAAGAGGPGGRGRSRRPRPSARPTVRRGRVRARHRSPTRAPAARRSTTSASGSRPGETVAVVGRNGAGKSTLIKLLCRLYDPTEGRILLDGVDLRELDPAAVRRLIGGMFQDYVTYQATAAENIGLGELGRLEDREAVEEAARKGGADSLLGRLPDGWDTPLGKWFDGGVELSGGEWQKIALGRAFMRDARILVLDEPTSALDAQAEFELFARLRRARRTAGRRSTSRIGSRPSARRTGSCSSSTARSSRRAPTTS